MGRLGAGGVGWRAPRPMALLLLLLLFLVRLLAAEQLPEHDMNDTFAFEEPPDVDEEDLTEPIVEMIESSGDNLTKPKEVEFGECTVTCGIGIREVLLINGCPGGETKCIVRMEECRGPADCGWGKPISESLTSVKIPCIFVPPENRFQYTWKMLIPEQQSLILPNDSAILEVHRDTHPVALECDTTEEGELIASVKYTIYTTAELETRRSKNGGADTVTAFFLISGLFICVGVILTAVLLFVNRHAIKQFWKTKIRKGSDEPSSGSMITSSVQLPTAQPSQMSQAENQPQELASYPEWNVPPGGEGEGGMGGGGGGGGGEGDKGIY
ncbi:sperm acrosome membrane-associated protein 1 [Anolis carolinensis]|uniref:Sperm acrosome associated 1 n=1 Tax=Anolis carolinensis TaxID=28377 RepID=G1KQB9_ANOCA|nr:PREDICTED: sperm acrosome membrane-associated protein 1 [Anolis carolinensis]|eukprot:XP_008117896.1 PREDICTED: sperm acrosome membrane-associated protein 1 [Anolis carolinensis]